MTVSPPPSLPKPRLRIHPPEVPLHIVLVHPEIPQNTGNIARICAATGTHLHLVGRLGFSIDEKAVRRAGLDYWHLVTVQQHDTFGDCLAQIGSAIPPLLFTTTGATTYLEAPYQAGCVLVFGAESCGLPTEILDRWPQSRFGIPTVEGTVRSLNLANAVAIVTYKALEQLGALGSPVLAP